MHEGWVKGSELAVKDKQRKEINKVNRKVFGQNTKKRFEKKLGHPFTSKAPLHGEHFHVMHLTKKKKKIK